MDWNKVKGNWRKSRQTGDWLLLANGLVFVILINLVASNLFFRIDLTEEKRYTIKEPTRKLLADLQEDVYIEVFLEGDLNSQFRRFRKSIKETLEEFRIYSKNKVHYTFTNPSLAISEKARNEFMTDLATRGVQGMRVIDSKQGEHVEKILFPGAVITCNGFERGVMLLKGNRAEGSQEAINQSIEGVEFELANTIDKLARLKRQRIGWIIGHGELDGLNVAGLNNALLEQYDVFKIDLPQKKSISDYDALIIVKPTQAFSEQDKFKLDQYIMKGGKVLFLLDELDAVMDSASQDNYYAFPYELKLEDQLFKYGVRINLNLIQDRVAGKYPVVVGEVDNHPKVMQLEWPFFPLVTHYANHPITRNLDATLTRFVSSIDTVKAVGIKKTALLFSSSYSHRAAAPVKIDINDLRKKPNPQYFREGSIPMAYLLEGNFTSLYKNRFVPPGMDSVAPLAISGPTKLIVLADGDVARNDVNPRTGQPLALGFDPIVGYTFANQDLLLNMMSFLTEENGLIAARNKEVKIRPLDQVKIKREGTFWQTLNVAIPLVLMILFGIGKAWVRKRKYANFQ